MIWLIKNSKTVLSKAIDMFTGSAAPTSAVSGKFPAKWIWQNLVISKWPKILSEVNLKRMISKELIRWVRCVTFPALKTS